MEPVSPARWLGAIVVGIFLGLVSAEAWLFRPMIGDLRWLAMVAGGAIGALAFAVWHLGQRLNTLEQRLTSGESSLPRQETATDSPAARTEPPRKTVDAQPQAAEPLPASKPLNTPRPSVAPPNTAPSAVRTFLTSNLPVKIGILVLFIGLAALLRYAADQGWLSMPIEYRLIGIALLGIAGLIIGWRQRHVRPIFGLSLQGGAIGILMLTIFAAFRLYPLLGQGWALGLAAILVAGGSVLAVVQRARGLALLSMTAGFAAPLLLGNENGGPLALFTWYAILNVGLFAIALARNWPLLTRLGFLATFVLATIWGVLTWQPGNYQIAQGFLIVFFALYFLIPIIQAVRHGSTEKLDIMLVFGLPLLALPLQIALLGDDNMAIAYSALIASAIYLVSALVLIRRWNLLRLGQAHAVLAAGLATLAVPFAFSGPTLVIIWALEGAALVWFGAADQRRLARVSGLLLIAAATTIWLLKLIIDSHSGDMLILNSTGLGGLALVLAFLLSAWRYQTAGAGSLRYNLLFGTGFLVWTVTGLQEVHQHFGPQSEIPALTGLALLSLLLAGFIHWNRRWMLAGLAAVGSLLGAAMLAASVAIEFRSLTLAEAVLWITLGCTVWLLDRGLARTASNWRARITLAAHLALTFFLIRLALYAATTWGLGEGWHWLLAAVPLLALTAWLLRGVRPPLCARPLPDSDHALLTLLAVLGVVLGLLGSLASSGSSNPLPWIPVLNPLEIAQLTGLILLISLSRRTRPSLPELPIVVPAGLVVLIATSAALRGVHQIAGVGWDPGLLASSEMAQASVSVTWTVLGVIAWVSGSRRKNTTLWRCGAILLAIVLVKLVLIDRQFLSTVAGILSFVAFGLLSILVGYLAPAPPATSEVDKIDHKLSDDDRGKIKL